MYLSLCAEHTHLTDAGELGQFRKINDPSRVFRAT